VRARFYDRHYGIPVVIVRPFNRSVGQSQGKGPAEGHAKQNLTY